MARSPPQFVSSHSGINFGLTFSLAVFFEVGDACREFRQVLILIIFGGLLSYTSSCFLVFFTENVVPIFLVV